ncbi:MAG: hypothetical protein P9C36_08330 [Defluviicoccus sp.]|nr:hypothetical protein [Defluviicoccus sp.]MDG4592615.1 hypothetical protein [Defluviicoccus sp.]MDS4010098.1 hypothetical protein [Defluviicoccus sp.]MDS4071572.1 hypothetical protein [Defluviicoccus sp.]
MLGTVQVVLKPSVFAGNGKEGDFAWMIEQPQYEQALFVFNDNESQFLSYMDGTSVGGGNAVIRPYQGAGARAAGVPTGPGYDALTTENKAIIDRALARVRSLIKSGRYTMLVYSADETDPSLLGHGIFDVGEDVRRYIVAELKTIASSAA